MRQNLLNSNYKKESENQSPYGYFDEFWRYILRRKVVRLKDLNYNQIFAFLIIFFLSQYSSFSLYACETGMSFSISCSHQRYMDKKLC